MADDDDNSNINLNPGSPMVVFKPLFSLNGHTACVNTVTWLDSKVLGAGTENPYAEG